MSSLDKLADGISKVELAEMLLFLSYLGGALAVFAGFTDLVTATAVWAAITAGYAVMTRLKTKKVRVCHAPEGVKCEHATDEEVYTIG